LDIFPEGDASSSPGLLYSATLGKMASEFPNPNGVAAGLHVESAMNSIADPDSRQLIRFGTREGLATTPAGLGNSPPSFPG